MSHHILLSQLFPNFTAHDQIIGGHTWKKSSQLTAHDPHKTLFSNELSQLVSAKGGGANQYTWQNTFGVGFHKKRVLQKKSKRRGKENKILFSDSNKWKAYPKQQQFHSILERKRQHLRRQ